MFKNFPIDLAIQGYEVSGYSVRSKSDSNEFKTSLFVWKSRMWYCQPTLYFLPSKNLADFEKMLTPKSGLTIVHLSFALSMKSFNKENQQNNKNVHQSGPYWFAGLVLFGGLQVTWGLWAFPVGSPEILRLLYLCLTIQPVTGSSGILVLCRHTWYKLTDPGSESTGRWWNSVLGMYLLGTTAVQGLVAHRKFLCQCWGGGFPRPRRDSGSVSDTACYSASQAPAGQLCDTHCLHTSCTGQRVPLVTAPRGAAKRAKWLPGGRDFKFRKTNKKSRGRKSEVRKRMAHWLCCEGVVCWVSRLHGSSPWPATEFWVKSTPDRHRSPTPPVLPKNI